MMIPSIDLRMLSEVDLAKPEVVEVGPLRAALYTHRAPDGTRDRINEDAALALRVDADRCVLAVADGMGGLPSGSQAAATALAALADAIAHLAGSDLREGVLDGFEEANRRVLELGIGAGTTLVVATVDGDRLRSFHVGDSALLVTGQRGRLKHQTVAHSPIGYAVESGLIDEDSAIAHNQRHIVSNAIGSTDMKIEIGPELRVAARDTIVLASDGLSDNLLTDDIVEAVRTGRLSRVASDLVKAVGTRMSGSGGKPDDLTFLVARPTPLPISS